MIRAFFCVLIGIVSLSACQRQVDESAFPGYIEGHFTYISAYNTGILSSLAVAKGQTTQSGDLLFVLADQPTQYDLKAAEERLKQAKEQEKQLQKEYDLQKTYLRQSPPAEMAASRARVNSANANLQVGRKNVNVVRSSLEKAEWASKQKSVRAPKNGKIFDVYYNTGEFIQAGTPVLSILDDDNLRIIFYIPENQLANTHINDVVYATCDRCSAKIEGKVIFISPEPEYSPPMIYSNESRQKLVYRIEAKVISDAKALHPGQPITVRFSHLK